MGLQERRGSTNDQTAHGRLFLALAAFAAANLAGCLADDMDPPGVDGGMPETETYSIGGEVTGLDDGSVDLSLNDSEILTLDSDGAFTFSTGLAEGESYTVTVDGHPEYSVCDLSSANGTVGTSDVSDVLAECEVLSVGTANRDQSIDLDWARAGDVDIAYSTDSDCDWVNAGSCENGGILPDQSGGSVTVDESDGLLADELYSFTVMVGEQSSRPSEGVISRFELSGWVKDVVINADRVYAGGTFLLNGAPVRGIAGFRDDAQEADFTGAIYEIGGGSVIVYDTATAPDGSRFVAGDFDSINGASIRGVVRLKPDGSVDESWSADIASGGHVTRVVVDTDRDRLYIAGEFSGVAGNTDYSNLAALGMDGNLDTSFSTLSPNAPVWTMATSDDLLYIGGEFDQVGAEGRDYIAAMDIDDGALNPDFVPLTDDVVRVLRHDHDRIVLGGMFTEINGMPQAHLGAVDAGDGSLDPDFQPEVDGIVQSVEEIDGQMLIGGNFSQVGGSSRSGLAAIDPQSGSLLSDWDVQAISTYPGSTNAGVLAIHVDEDFVYLGGSFGEISGADRHGVARFARDTGDLDEDWVPLLDAVRVWAVEGGDAVTVAGRFRGAGGRRLDNLAAFELASGKLDPAWDVGTDDWVNALETDGQKVFVGGDFSEFYSGGASVSQSHAVAVDFQGAVDTDWLPEPNGDIDAMVINGAGDTIYLGGGFSEVKGETRGRLAAVNPDTGDPLVTGDPDIAGSVFDLAWADSYDGVPAVIVGGNFSSAGGEARDNHAVLQHDFGDVHPDAFDPDTHLFGVHYNNNEAYQLIGGGFQNVAGNAQARFAAFENDTTFDNSSPEADGWVYEFGMDDVEGKVFMGGSFTAVGGEPRRNLAIMDYSSGSGLSVSSDTVDTDGWVRGIAMTADYLVLGGNFRHVAGERRSALVVLDRSSLTPVSLSSTQSISSGTLQQVPIDSGATGEVSESRGGWD